MKFESPIYFIFLLFVPVIFMLYFLKQKFTDHIISSTYLWDGILKNTQISKPWQKLMKSLLMVIQIIAIILLALVLVNPILTFNKANYDKLVIVMDMSGSMNSIYKGKMTRLEASKKAAVAFLSKIDDVDSITLIEAADHPVIRIEDSSNKKYVINTIKSLHIESTGNNKNELAQLINKLSSHEGTKTLIYTDKNLKLSSKVDASYIRFNSKITNLSLDQLFYSKVASSASGVDITVKATNRSKKALLRTICVYDDKSIVARKKVRFRPYSSKNLYFKNITIKSPYLKVGIKERDSLQIDNTIYKTLNSKVKKKVLLVTNKNLYLEKIFNILNQISNNSMSIKLSKKLTGQYDLYVIDGIVTDSIPKNGNILYVNPPKGNKLIKAKKEITGGKAIKIPGVFTGGINDGFNVEKMMNITLPYWGSNIFVVNDHPLIFSGEKDYQKIMIMAFDLNKSDFPLTSEYPVFMNSAVNFLLDSNEKTSYFCNENLQIHIPYLNTRTKLQMVSPDNKVSDISSNSTTVSYRNTLKNGIYTLMSNSKPIGYYAVNFDTSTENQITTANSSNPVNNFATRKYFNIRTILMLILLILVAVEWVVCLNEH